MKTTSLLFAFACLTFQSYSQYARSIYSDESSPKHHTSLFSINGETTVVNLRESSNDTLRVMLIDIDDEGETDNYRMYEYSPFDVSSQFALSGSGTNSSGELTLCILHQNTSNSLNVKYITIDPTNGTFSNPFDLTDEYRKGFTRTRVKGDSLITYLANYSTTGITRIARSLSNTGTASELAASNVTYSGTLFQNNTACELIIHGSDEFVATPDLIMKRDASANYTETSHQAVMHAPSLTVNTSGDLYILNRNSGDFTKLDDNLNPVSSGNIPELQGIFNGLTEIYALPNDQIRIWTSRTPQPKVLDIDASSNIIQERRTRNYPLYQATIDGQQYIIGLDAVFSSKINEDGFPFQSSSSSVTIVSDDLSSDVADFIEYDQLLSTDKIRFNVNHLGMSFTNMADVSAGFEFKQNDIFRSLIYAAGSNTIGTNLSGHILGSTVMYESELAPGPYTTPGNYSMEMIDKYNRGYFVTAEMIEIHINEITSGNPAYKIPFGIREWPAHGDVSLGQEANLADFIDQNGNGEYEPELGDYPAIYGEQCLLNIYHEHPNAINSGATETHQYYFTFDCDSEEAIENAVFVRTHKFSRDQTLFNTYTGDYVDFDLGNFSDDYVGTNVELGMTYAYNGDFFDEDGNGKIGFHDTIPAVGLISLKGSQFDDDGIDNPTTTTGGPATNGVGFGDGIVDNEFFTMESSMMHTSTGMGPNSLVSWYFSMQGLNPDSSPKTVNGVTVRHDYFGTSDPLFYTSYGVDHGNNHSETGVPNPPGDRRISNSCGPTTFSTLDTMVLIKAFIVGVDTTNLSPDNSVNRLFEHGQTLRDFYAQNSDDCGNTFDVYLSDNQLSVEEEKIEQILVYPNPANQHIQFKGIAGQADLNIFDLNGRAVLSLKGIDDNHSIDISNLDKAIYLIKISDENGSQTIRMIKQ